MPLDLPAVPALDNDAAAGAAELRQALPVGALGIWGSVIDLLAAAAGTADRPLAPRRPQLVVLAADHGIAQLDISAAPSGETTRRAVDLAIGRGLPAALAGASGVGITVVDVGLDEPVPEVPDRAEDARPANRIDTGDAMTQQQAQAAFETGRRVADAEIDAGADLLIGAVCGVGVSTPVAVLTAALTGMEPVDATSRGSGVDDGAWIRKAAAVRDALFRVRQRGFRRTRHAGDRGRPGPGGTHRADRAGGDPPHRGAHPRHAEHGRSGPGPPVGSGIGQLSAGRRPRPRPRPPTTARPDRPGAADRLVRHRATPVLRLCLWYRRWQPRRRRSTTSTARARHRNARRVPSIRGTPACSDR